jgi:glucokinase-like ROK family protein
LSRIKQISEEAVRKGNQKLVKSINRSIVLNIVREHGPVSRADVSRLSEFYPATVSSIVNDLISEGFVRETGLGDSTGGRQPIMLQLDRRAYVSCGVEISVDRLKACVTDLDAQVIASEERPLDWKQGPRECMPSVVDAAQKVLDRAGVGPERILGIGVVYPGPVDDETGMILASPHMPGWGGFALKEALEAEFRFPIVVDNDANAAAWGEKWFGAAKGHSSYLYIMADYGLGGGIVIDDQLYRGRNGGAGEFGHMTVDVDGPQCKCGNFGCLDVMASAEAIVNKVISDIKRGAVTSCIELAGGSIDAVTIDTVLEAAGNGDAHSRAVVEEAGRYLGIGLASLVNWFNPELIVLGGRLPLESPLYLESASETARRRAWSALGKNVCIVLSTLGPSACLIGAASLMLTRVFESPSVVAYA